MFIMVTCTWPTKSSIDMGKLMIESVTSNPLPEWLKRHGMYLLFDEGLKAYGLYEVEEGHEYEGYKEVCNRHVVFFPVEGYKTTVECLIAAEEGLNFVGLSM